MTTDKKIEDYEKLVYSIINKYNFLGETDDLYQVGMIGLLKACENFDDSYGVKFSTYAHTYIVGEVLKYVRDNKPIRINRDLVRLSRNIERAKEVLSQKLMHEASISELSAFLEVPEKTIEEAMISSNFVKSLDYELNDEGRELNLYDSIKYEENGYDSDIMDLHDSIDSLSEEEKLLINYRYFEGRTQSDISSELGMSQVQVSRSEAKILQKLRNKLS